MRRAIRSTFTAFLATLVATLDDSARTTWRVLPSQGIQASNTSSELSSGTELPTITFVSYITISNSSITVNPSTQHAVTTFTDRFNTLTLTNLCPEGPDCYDPKSPSKTAWMSVYAYWLNPYLNYEWYLAEIDPRSSALQQTCSERWEASFFQYMSTAPWSNDLTPTVMEYAHLTTEDSSTFTTTYPYMPIVPYSDFKEFSFTPSPPCCGSCAFTIGDAQVYQWPVSDKPSLAPTLVNEAGYTFIYPSIYVDFQTIAATDSCGELGTGLTRSTMAFDASQLSTANSYFFASTSKLLPQLLLDLQPEYTQFDDSSTVSCANITTTLYYLEPWGQIANASGPWTSPQTYYPNSTVLVTQWVLTGSPFAATYNPCTPWISAPDQILTLEPRWSSCSRNMKGIHDPEIVLTASAGFYPVTTVEPHHPKSSDRGDASAGPSLSQAFATKTAPSSHPTSLSADKLPAQVISTLPAVATIGAMTITANADSAFVIGPFTVKPGEQIVYLGTTISMASDGQGIDIDGTTQHLNPSYAMGTQPLIAGTPAVILSGTTYFAAIEISSVINGSSREPIAQGTGVPNADTGQQFWIPAYMIHGETLIAGGTPITASGTTMSLEPGGSSVVMVLATTITKDINMLLGSSASTQQTTPSGNSSSSSDPETENRTSLNADLLSTSSVTDSRKPRSGAPRSQRVKRGQLLCWVALVRFFSIARGKITRSGPRKRSSASRIESIAAGGGGMANTVAYGTGISLSFIARDLKSQSQLTTRDVPRGAMLAFYYPT
ncbi:hypothetical protein N431DRAFT_536822 [Stipitochalara longipes BDJ]|nr:hypothetical protein N431DRAFT_536822 [Stipitochalara longipes BDJ]